MAPAVQRHIPSATGREPERIPSHVRWIPRAERSSGDCPRLSASDRMDYAVRVDVAVPQSRSIITTATAGKTLTSTEPVPPLRSCATLVDLSNIGTMSVHSGWEMSSVTIRMRLGDCSAFAPITPFCQLIACFPDGRSRSASPA